MAVSQSDHTPSQMSPSSDASDSLPPSHYASYNLICCIQDSPAGGSKSSVVRTVTFFTTCIVISLIGGFGLHMAINSRKYQQGMKEGMKAAKKKQQQQRQKQQHVRHQDATRRGGAGSRTVVLEDPVIFATRALGWGTLYSILGSGSIGLTAVCIWKL